MSFHSSQSRITILTTPGDDWSCGDDGVPRCRRWRIKALRFIPPATSPANLPITSADFSPHRGQEAQRESQTESCDFSFYSYWHEHDAVVCSAKLGDTVQKHRRHLLVSVFDKTEDLEGKTSHLTLPVLENCRLWVFVAAESNEYDTNTHMHTLNMTELMSRCMLKHSLRSIHLGISC